MSLLNLLLPYPVFQLTGAVGLFILFYFFWRPKVSNYKKPFETDARLARAPLETDLKKRDKRLKQRFLPREIPENLDAIVVGSGAGGLISAAILAKTGRKVLVLEQHDQAGGCCHTFVENGYEWDVGIHYIGQMGPNHFDRFMLDQVTDGQMGWHELADDFDNCVFIRDGKIEFIPIWKDRQRHIKELAVRYPEHEDKIRKFFDLMKVTSKGFIFFPMIKVMPYWLAWLVIKTKFYKLTTNFFKDFHENKLKDLLDDWFGDNEELKTVLNYMWGDYGVPPARVGYGMMSILYGHYAQGGYYPIGGSSEIAYHLIPVIERSGGRVLVNANVSEILVDSGKAYGVKVATSSGPVEIRSDCIISDAGVQNTFKHLLPKEVAQKCEMTQLVDSGRIHPSTGAVQVFVGINGSQEELKLPAKNFWVNYKENLTETYDEWVALEGFDEAADMETVPLLFLGFPSAKDPSYSERFPGKSACTIITFVPNEWFKQWDNTPKGRRGGDYEAAKMRLARRMWESVVDMFPQLQDTLDYIDAGTPPSHNYYINAYAGEAYGLEADTERFSPDVTLAVRPKVPEIGNLYLTGQDTLSVGFAAAIYSAFLTCQTIMQPLGETSNLLGDIKKLFRKHRVNGKVLPPTGENNGKVLAAEN